MKTIAHGIMTLTSLGLLAGALPAWAEGNAPAERVAKIEQSLADLQAAMRQQGAEVANQMAKVDQVLSEQNSFQGTVDAVSQQQQLLFEQLKKYIDEFESRLQRMEQKMALGEIGEDSAVEAAAVLPVDGAVGKGAPATTGATGLYQEALNAVRDRRYEEAIIQFRNFLQTAPQHTLADRAQFWIGECHYAVGEYPQAIDAYNGLLTKFPASQKTAVALFRKANAYAELGKMHEAQQTFRDLIATAPNSKEAKHASSQLQAIMNATAERTEPSTP